MFKFKLQVPLNYRKRLEEQERIAFAKAMNEVNAEEDKLIELKKKYMELGKEYTNFCEGTPDIESIRLFGPYIKRLKFEERQQVNRIEDKKNAVEKRREILVTAMKNRKVLERLKEKKHSDYLVKERLREQKSVDEISSTRYSTRMHHV
jgi:flagellar FliJ protein